MLSITRKNLYEKIWSIGISKTAKELGVPYNKLKKACIDNSIPLPTQSYWSKLYMGNEKPLQPELPNKEEKHMINIDKTKKQHSKSIPKKVSKVEKTKKIDKSQEVKIDNDTMVEKEMIYFSYLKHDEDKLIKVYNDLKINKILSNKPHKEIVKYRKKTQSYREDKLRIKSASGEIFPDVLPFIDSLFKALEKVGAKILCKFDETEVTFNDKYIFTLIFKLPCKRVNLSPDDKKYSEYHTFEYETKGTINVEVGYKVHWRRWGRNEKSINQTKRMTTEDLLRKVFIYIFSLPEIIDEEEKAYIIKEEQRVKDEKEKMLLQEKRDNEYEKTQKLINNSLNYFYSKLIKEYIAAELVKETEKYEWARNKADWMCDSEKYPDEILTEKDKEYLIKKNNCMKY